MNLKLLILIGYGISGFKGISLRGLEIARECDEVYLEAYTSPVKVNLREAESILGRKVEKLTRKELEDGGEIIQESMFKKVAILTPGDPLIATTHISLLLEAERNGIETEVIHAASIYTVAIGESGLHIYKFGRTGTLTVPRDFVPFSIYNTITENMKKGLHTLLLLQQDPSSGEFLSARDALNLLVKMSTMKGDEMINKDTIAIVLSGLKTRSEIKLAGKTGRLIRALSHVPVQSAVIIIPGDLHFMEKRALKRIWVD